MMDDIILDDYLRAYRLESECLPDEKFKANILAIADQERAEKKAALNFWHWFDLTVPRVVGWTLTCMLGLYLGLPRTEQSAVQDDYFLYDQAQILLSEDLTLEDSQK